jgi:hypothetical protein
MSYGPATTPATRPPATVSVRPDMVFFSCSWSLESTSPVAALASLRRAFERLDAQVKQTAPQATVRLEDFDVPSEGGAGKLMREPRARLTARVELPLDASLAFFARAELVAKVDEALLAAVLEAKKQKPAIDLHVHAPLFFVTDVEAHRERLVAGWRARLDALKGATPLTVTQVRADAPITQSPSSLEVVELSLDLGGVVSLER